MRITILGGGAIATPLAQAWALAGHPVTLGLRGTGRTTTIAGVRIADTPQAIADGEVIVLAIPPTAVPTLYEQHGAACAARSSSTRRSRSAPP